ncbi:cold-shock protein [Chloroflexota bacterium]
MPKGTIRRLMNNYGFIKTEQGDDLFFHRNQLQGVYFASLREGQEVEFELGRDRNDRPEAVGVRLAATESSQDEPATAALEDVGVTPGEPQAEEITQEDQD